MRTFKNYITEQKASDVLKNWRHDDAKEYAERLIKTFREPDESKRIRMIIRVLKQHSAVKINENLIGDA